MPPVSLKNKLAGISKSWQENAKRAKSESGSSIEPGKYIARLTEATVDPNSLRWNMLFIVLEGDSHGVQVRKSDGIESEQGQFYAARTMAVLGYDPTEYDITQLPEICKELAKAKPVCRINVRSKDGYNNTYVEALIDDYEGAEEGESEEGEEGGITVGSRVTFTFSGAEDAGEVIEVLEDGNARIKRDSNGKVVKKALDAIQLEASAEEAESEEEEEAEESEEEETVTLQVGMKVGFTFKGKEETGEVLEIVDEEFARVKKDSDSKVAKVKIENLGLLEDGETDEGDEAEEEEEEEEAPKTAPKRGRPAGAKNKPKA